jgi:hypothetical protein
VVVNIRPTLGTVKASLLRWPVIAALAIIGLAAIIVSVHLMAWAAGATAGGEP